jgi:hypothetical protein
MPSYFGGGWGSLRWSYEREYDEEPEAEALDAMDRVKYTEAGLPAGRRSRRPVPAAPAPEPTLTSKARRIDLDDE